MKRHRITAETSDKIRSLRAKGQSVPEISAALNVPKTTVFRHIQGVKILPEFLTEWSIKRGGSNKRRILKETRFLAEGKEMVGNLSDRESSYFCPPYIGEKEIKKISS